MSSSFGWRWDYAIPRVSQRAAAGSGWRVASSPLIRRFVMNIVILGILTKTVLLVLGVIGLLLALSRGLGNSGRRQILPVLAIVPFDFQSPVRSSTRRWILSPSRAPPEMPFFGHS